MATVETRDVRKQFGDVWAVDGVDLSTKEGEFLVLLGPSGCGKTTLLRMIAGLERPTQGEILIGGQVVNDLPPRARKIAMVFQSYALYPHLTVYKNIAFPLKAQGVPKAEIPGKVQWAASLFGIERLLERKPRQLSGGERQRVALARAVIREPAVFLLDEPLSNLDAKLRTSAREELQQFQRRIATTTVYVTHDQVEAMGLGDRIAVMHLGKVRQIGSPTEVYDEPADTFVAGFLGSPPMNLVEGPDALVGFRPEHFLPPEAHRAGDELVTLPIRVHRQEYLGADRLVYGTPEARFREARVISRLPSTVTTAVMVGDRQDFAVRVGDLKFFDRQSGRRTTPRPL
jgi:multiple sugar transport system ATP-binding protein